MDSFAQGPAPFDVVLSTGDSLCYKTSKFAQYRFALGKNLLLAAGPWECCCKQIIFNGRVQNLRDDEEDRTIRFAVGAEVETRSIVLPEGSIDTAELLVLTLQRQVPQGAKLEFAYNARLNRLQIRTTNIRIFVNSSYLAALLGVEIVTFYPDTASVVEKTVEAPYPPDFLNGEAVFRVAVDFVAPQIWSSQYVSFACVDALPADNKSRVVAYNYARPSFVPVQRSYFSQIALSLIDSKDRPLELADTRQSLIVRFMFRRQTTGVL
jgi:hypothetical protein